MDIDIDLPPDFIPEDHFNIVKASINENGKLRKHPAGVYFQNIPKDEITGLSAIPYNVSEDFGFFKIDFLHLSLLKDFKSKSEIRNLLKQEPDWTLLEREDVVKNLFHIGKHYPLVKTIKPTSVQQLSDILALIRPGKQHLIDDYLEDPDSVREELYTKRINSDMRKSHTIPYSLLIILQLHKVKENENILKRAS